LNVDLQDHYPVCKQAAYQDPRQGSVILRQQTSLSVDLQDHVPANDFQRQPPRSSASKRPAAPKISGQQAAFSSNFRILGQQTTFSANLGDPRQANDVQRGLRGVLASKTISSANPEDPRPANPSAPTPRILGQQTTRQPRGSLSRKQALAATSHIAKLPAQSANQAPISHASGSLVCEFVHQIASV